jgi:hypothetical protein
MTQDRCTAVFDGVECGKPRYHSKHIFERGNWSWGSKFAHPFTSRAEAPTSEASCTKESAGVDAPLPTAGEAPVFDHRDHPIVVDGFNLTEHTLDVIDRLRDVLNRVEGVDSTTVRQGEELLDELLHRLTQAVTPTNIPLCSFPGCGKPEDAWLHHCSIGRDYQHGCHPFQEGVGAPLPSVASAPRDEFDPDATVTIVLERFAVDRIVKTWSRTVGYWMVDADEWCELEDALKASLAKPAATVKPSTLRDPETYKLVPWLKLTTYLAQTGWLLKHEDDRGVRYYYNPTYKVIQEDGRVGGRERQALFNVPSILLMDTPFYDTGMVVAPERFGDYGHIVANILNDLEHYEDRWRGAILDDILNT